MNTELTVNKLLNHYGCTVTIVKYGNENVALECEQHHMVLADGGITPAEPYYKVYHLTWEPVGPKIDADSYDEYFEDDGLAQEHYDALGDVPKHLCLEMYDTEDDFDGGNITDNSCLASNRMES